MHPICALQAGCPSSYVALNQVKAILAVSMLRVGAETNQISDALNSLDALPMYAAVPVTYQPQCPQHESNAERDKTALVEDQMPIHNSPVASFADESAGCISRKVCRRFRRSGFCKYGEECRFLHMQDVPRVQTFDIHTPSVSEASHVDEIESTVIPEFPFPCEQASVQGVHTPPQTPAQGGVSPTFRWQKEPKNMDEVESMFIPDFPSLVEETDAKACIDLGENEGGTEPAEAVADESEELEEFAFRFEENKLHQQKRMAERETRSTIEIEAEGQRTTEVDDIISAINANTDKAVHALKVDLSTLGSDILFCPG